MPVSRQERVLLVACALTSTSVMLGVAAAGVGHRLAQDPGPFEGAWWRLANGDCAGRSDGPIVTEIPPELQPWVAGGSSGMRLSSDCEPQRFAELHLRPDTPRELLARHGYAS